LFDFLGDNKTDFVTLSDSGAPAASRTWRILANSSSPAIITQFTYGVNGDVILARDFIGNEKSDAAVYRPGATAGAQGIFFVTEIPRAGVSLDRVVRFGGNPDNPNGVGDYDGDNKIDYTVVRNNNGTQTWFIISSSNNTMRAINFGATSGVISTLVAVNGSDFNGDGRDELVFFGFGADPNDATQYFAGDAVTGAGVYRGTYGDFGTDFAVTPADYTGDGRSDLVAVRAANGALTWFIFNTAIGNTSTVVNFGLATDRPIRGDYDGDGRQDVAVYRPSNTTFYFIRSSNGQVGGQQWGQPGDVPLGQVGVF